MGIQILQNTSLEYYSYIFVRPLQCHLFICFNEPSQNTEYLNTFQWIVPPRKAEQQTSILQDPIQMFSKIKQAHQSHLKLK